MSDQDVIRRDGKTLVRRGSEAEARLLTDIILAAGMARAEAICQGNTPGSGPAHLTAPAKSAQ